MTTLAATALDTLAPIGLEELVERAELLTRVDRKYVVPVRAAEEILRAVPASTRVLEIAGRRGFGYRSTYLDTPERDSYLSAGRGHRRRWKVRTRAYLDTGGTWLEVKTRSARGATLKQRIEHPEAESQVAPLTEAGHGFVADIVGTAVADRIHPVLVTGYHRTTLFLPESASRVTLDVDLGWTALAPQAPPRDLERPGVAIVETKTGSTPSPVDHLLWRRGHRPLRISKYGVGMAALDPALPRLKWHRVLGQHLSLPRSN
ncbi:polyphosphate polymerase domain-containing protein [Nocardioides sp. AE5]|uniref:polyphosphate polymerase domain-containing protein n=1 Tax=Nocardioides sp. AE5 TaxID=2962573 RepID=UPI002882CD94|nr:polyphosphate polymerase domain-containing protein [Nocardioides sp. AE5]MDT0200923.1 polyphosphate polymerase domain-containing protein [Nocardioides sp. AE5]